MYVDSWCHCPHVYSGPQNTIKLTQLSMGTKISSNVYNPQPASRTVEGAMTYERPQYRNGRPYASSESSIHAPKCKRSNGCTRDHSADGSSKSLAVSMPIEPLLVSNNPRASQCLRSRDKMRPCRVEHEEEPISSPSSEDAE